MTTSENDRQDFIVTGEDLRADKKQHDKELTT